MIRIIAGKYRSRLLEQPSKQTTRPTTDRAREGLFSSIQFNIEGKEFLDLFSGSGAFCLEALSRGASHAVCVEKDKKAYETIIKNKKNLKEANLEVHWTDCFNYLKNNFFKQFDYIYLDPPYKLRKELYQAIDMISTNNMLKDGGYLIIETDLDNFEYESNGYKVVKTKKYGKIYFYYLQH
ncbi:16S rRNA (guanine(966)-N(2))-methyltransferase RsmD [[Mycoplasma] anseris]|uniref:16S rRNA (Guanine(966)-N(2))-methyltransferase RsmD n=1 Tax=[Mycoplasma] anseris TaxID=92400 RepID=A0A2Z4ND61_9BACT|nr:16S rRNA (guanine(966)-N(2))-methyltransferase RsmD [[Mycoplasma] anseris]AWX69521.1 16S rRNA (guanine(966)-N(2))-methyltransferase RsmD [[Mycoplasma] anseris]